jgi:UDP-glucose 4-epimerase
MPFIMQVAVGRRERLRSSATTTTRPTAPASATTSTWSTWPTPTSPRSAPSRIEGCRPVNVGTGTGSSVLEVVAAAARAVGHEIPYEVVGRRAGDAPCVYADTSLATELLGWRATRTLDDMCADHWRWQRENPDGLRAAG